MGTNALMGSNFDCVSNRSYSRMHGSIEVKDQTSSKITVAKGSSKSGSSRDIPKSSGHGGSASNNNNQLSIHRNSSAPMQLYTDSSDERIHLSQLSVEEQQFISNLQRKRVK
jgi:hypothetical protein